MSSTLRQQFEALGGRRCGRPPGRPRIVLIALVDEFAGGEHVVGLLHLGTEPPVDEIDDLAVAADVGGDLLEIGGLFGQLQGLFVLRTLDSPGDLVMGHLDGLFGLRGQLELLAGAFFRRRIEGLALGGGQGGPLLRHDLRAQPRLDRIELGQRVSWRSAASVLPRPAG